MPAPPPQCPWGGHIPQEDLLVPTHACEAGIVGGDGDVEHLIAMCGVCLDETVAGGRDFGRIVEMDRAVGGTGEDLVKGKRLWSTWNLER